MLINSVIFVLQETLEAALLISVFLTISLHLGHSLRWLAAGFFAGLFFAFLYALNMAQVSEWFDYVGQEVTNATLQATITLFIGLYVLTLQQQKAFAADTGTYRSHLSRRLFFAATASVACAITVEGSEIFIYMQGVFLQSDALRSALTGSIIGVAIGVSAGVLLLYLLRSLSTPLLQPMSFSLLALFAGNMLSQAALKLTQADWIPSTAPLWDTSQWVSESSVSGRLLYALIGYEATPSLAQIISYLLGAGLVITLARLTIRKEPPGTNNL